MHIRPGEQGSREREWLAVWLPQSRDRSRGYFRGGSPRDPGRGDKGGWHAWRAVRGPPGLTQRRWEGCGKQRREGDAPGGVKWERCRGRSGPRGWPRVPWEGSGARRPAPGRERARREVSFPPPAPDRSPVPQACFIFMALEPDTRKSPLAHKAGK